VPLYYINIYSISWDNYNKLWTAIGTAVGEDYKIKSFTSVDGINWNNSYTNITDSQPLIKIISVGNRYIGLKAFSSYEQANYIYASNNLIDWHEYIVKFPLGSYQDLRISNIYWDGRKVIATGTYYNTSVSDERGLILTSPDGINYSIAFNGSNASTPIETFNNIFEYKGDVYIRGVNTDTNFSSVFYKSSDLITWDFIGNGFTGESKGNELVYTTYMGSENRQIYHTTTTIYNSDYSAQYFEFSVMKSRFVKNYPRMNVTCPIVIAQLYQIYPNSLDVRVRFESDGGTDIIQKGICWSTSPNPTLADPHTEDGAYSDDYIATAINLLPNTIYHIRAYATNSECTVYSDGDAGAQTYASLLPTVATRYVTNVGSTTASFEGSVIDDGGTTVTDRGFCWSTSNQTPTIANSNISAGSGMGLFYASISGLSQNTTYYVRAYGFNGNYGYGSTLTFTTGESTCVIPTLQGINISNITLSTADAQSTILSDGGCGLISLGFCYSTTNPNPTTSDTTIGGTSFGGNLTASLTGLNSLTTYYIRAYATNSVGTGYSTNIISSSVV